MQVVAFGLSYVHALQVMLRSKADFWRLPIEARQLCVADESERSDAAFEKWFGALCQEMKLQTRMQSTPLVLKALAEAPIT